MLEFRDVLLATGITPAMSMRLTGIGSQYVFAMRASEGKYFDGGRNYRLTLPPDVPESRFWSVLLYDKQTRSMLQTNQHLPRLGSESGTVEANPRRLDRHLLRDPQPEGKETTGSNDPPARVGGQSCVLQPTAGVLRQELETQRDRTDLAAASSRFLDRVGNLGERAGRI